MKNSTAKKENATSSSLKTGRRNRKRNCKGGKTGKICGNEASWHPRRETRGTNKEEQSRFIARKREENSRRNCVLSMMMMMMIRVPENYILVISRRSLDRGLRKGLKERERIIMHPLEKTETTMGRWEMR